MTAVFARLPQPCAAASGGGCGGNIPPHAQRLKHTGEIMYVAVTRTYCMYSY